MIDTERKDPRRGKPSASNIERYSLCHRSYLLEKQVPESERFKGKDAEIGDRIHLSNETGDLSILASLPEEDLVRRIRAKEEQIFTQWITEYNITDAEIRREERLWLRAGKSDLASAKPDFYALSQSKRLCLVIDAKSGRKGVTPPVRNWQLRTAVVILAANYAIVGARVAIVQPLAQTQPQADYSPEAIYGAGGARNELNQLLTDIQNPDAKATPGEHCTFCNARHICPEAQAVAKRIADLKGVKWSTLSAARKLELWVVCKIAEPIIKGIKENVKAEIKADPAAIPGLVKDPDQFPREIIDTAGVYGKLSEHFGGDFQPQEFTALCGISVGDLTDFVRKISGKSEDEADLWINTNCDSFIKKNKREGSIKLEKAI